MILEILSLDALISSMATSICSRERFVSTNFSRACLTKWAAALEFSLFLEAIELISSTEAEVSSSEAACSEAPCASAWLEEETCPAALLVYSPPQTVRPPPVAGCG
jgi:hypothetical protein